MRNLGCVFLTVFLVAAIAPAQVSTGTIHVEVRDTSGAVVAEAVITLTHVSTGQVRLGKSNDQGEFVASFVQVGSYSIATEAAGFRKKVVTGLDLRVDQSARVAVSLEVGDVREVVQVSDVTPLLESDTSSLGQVIDNKKILDLPLNGRNPFALGLLVGNTTPISGMGSNLPFIGGGGRYSANDVLLDGVDDNTTVNAGAIGRNGIAYTPSVDAVQEFKVKTGTFSAEFGHAAGTVINATTRSGANDFHGTLFEFLRNDKLDANNFFTNAAGRPKAKFRQNQFGGVLGGRLIRNRTFFFMDYQGTRQRTAAGSSIIDLPPADLRAGNFSKLPAPVFDPGTRRIGPAGTVIATPFPGSQIPASQMNPASLAVMDLVPLPNFGPAGSLSRNYFTQTPRRFNGDQWDVRVDHSISHANNMFGRFSFGNQVRPNPGWTQGFIGGGTSDVDFTRQLVLSDTHIFTPNTVNEFRFGYVRHNGSIVGDAPKGVEFAQKHGIALLPFPARGFPSFTFNYAGSISGSQQFNGFGGGNSNLNFENRFQWADNLNLTRGGHTLKMGVDARRARFETLKGDPFFGGFIFGSFFSSSADTPGSGAPFADFLMGFPASIQGIQMLDWGRQRDIYFGGYFQDDWKVTRNLTVNLGIRYDIFTQPVDARDRGSLFNLEAGQFQVPGQNGFSRALVDGDHNNFAPRVGLAWQVSSKLVVRGGFGIFYGLRDQSQEGTQFSANIPNSPTLSVPVITASGTVKPPFTINTPILAGPTDPTLSSFTPDRPLARTIKSQGFHDARTPTLSQFNFNVQYEPFPTWLFEVALSGARGRDLATLFFNQNQVPFEYALDGRNTQRNRRYANINGVVLGTYSTASSSYHAANFKMEKRYSFGLSFLANYTIQKNMENNGSGPLSFAQNGGTSIMLDSFNPGRERGVAPIDVPQIFVVSYGYELPWFKKSSRVARSLFGGWQVNGINSARGGFPTDIRTNNLPPVFNTFNVADRVAGQPMQIQENRGVDSFFNPAAFRVPRTVPSKTGAAIQLFGDSARRVTRGPGSVNFDFSVFKETALTERAKLQFRTEFFNVTNTPTFFLPAASSPTLNCMGAPGAACNAGNPQFGKLSSGTATGRQIQFGLKFLF
jgi:hypothetical protein